TWPQVRPGRPKRGDRARSDRRCLWPEGHSGRRSLLDLVPRSRTDTVGAVALKAADVTEAASSRAEVGAVGRRERTGRQLLAAVTANDFKSVDRCGIGIMGIACRQDRL